MIATGVSPSFRDPDGYLLRLDGQIIRVVTPAGREALEAFLASATYATLVSDGRVPRTRLLTDGESAELQRHPTLRALGAGAAGESLVWHEAVPFVSYPYEWTPDMLHAAAAATLDLAERLLPEGMGLKDATPYNVLFNGAAPVFVDLLSVERREPGDPVWLSAAQFERTFLLPLLVNRRFGLPLQQLLTNRRDGLEPAEVYRLLGPLARLSPTCLFAVSLPTWLSRRAAARGAALYQRRPLADRAKAAFILTSTYTRLRRLLARVHSGAAPTSSWSRYVETGQHYSDADMRTKRAFVEDALRERRPGLVLDLGCNTGQFSRLAAQAGARVVAVDSDAPAVEELYRTARDRRLDILPVVADVTRPTPALGWRNREYAALLDRARGADAVLMLALIHHWIVDERIPLAEIIDLAAELSRDVVVLEYVAPSDPMFRQIARGRDHLFADLTVAGFEDACRARFDVVRAAPLCGEHRRLYLLRKTG